MNMYLGGDVNWSDYWRRKTPDASMASHDVDMMASD